MQTKCRLCNNSFSKSWLRGVSFACFDFYKHLKICFTPFRNIFAILVKLSLRNNQWNHLLWWNELFRDTGYPAIVHNTYNFVYTATGYPANETGYSAGYWISKKAGYPAGRISGTTLITIIIVVYFQIYI